MALSAFHLFLAQASSPAAGADAPTGSATGPSQGGIPPTMVVFYVLIIGAMYFLMFAPQRKKQKEHEKMLAALQPGDEIVSTGGLYGVITSVKDDRFVVRIADSTKVELGKSFVQAVVKSQAAGDKK